MASLSGAQRGPVFSVFSEQMFVGLEHAELAPELLQVDVMGDDSAAIAKDEILADVAARWCGARLPQRLTAACKRAADALRQCPLRERYEDWFGLSARHRHRLRLAAGFLAAQPDVGRPIANHRIHSALEFFYVGDDLLSVAGEERPGSTP